MKPKYSNEFKQEVLNYYKQTNRFEETYKKFNISYHTLRRWTDPKFHKKMRQISKDQYYNDPIYKQKHITTINNLRLQKMKDPVYRQKNNEYYNQWITKRYHSNLRIRLKYQLRVKLKDVIKKYGNGAKKSAKTFELTGCTIDELMLHLEKQFHPNMSWDNYGKWHIDHIIPCSSFDLSKPEEQRKCFHYTNLQPLWATDNIKKGNKIPVTPIK